VNDLTQHGDKRVTEYEQTLITCLKSNRISHYQLIIQLFQIILIVKNLILIFMVLSDILRLYQFAINRKDVHLQMAQQ